MTIENETQETSAPDPIEAKARVMGWRPKDEFTDRYPEKAGKWVDAKSFVDRGDVSRGIMFERMQHIHDANEKLRAKVQALENVAERIMDGTKAQLNAQEVQWGAERERLNSELEILREQRDDAIRAANPSLVKRIDTEIGRVEKVSATYDAAKEQRKAVVSPPQLAPIPKEVEEWVSANPWFKQNKNMGGVAISAFQEAEDAGASVADCLVAAEDAVKKVFPSKFAPRSSPVYSGSPGRGGGDAPKDDLSSMSRAEREVFERAEKSYVAKGLGTKEKFRKEYFGK
jgi:hypothetical protein